MINRRDFFKASGTSLAGLTGLAVLVNDSQAYQRFKSESTKEFKLSDLKKDIERLEKKSRYTRESMILTYEEWKELREIPNPPNNNEELSALRKVQEKLRPKLSLLELCPEKVYDALTDKEKYSYESELHLFDAEEIPSYCTEIRIRYGFDFTAEQFEKSKGAKIVWFLDRCYSYRYNDEKSKGRK